MLLAVVGIQIEVRSTWAVPTTGGWPVSFGVALRMNVGQTQRTDCGIRMDGARNASLITRVNNMGAIVDSVRCHQTGNSCGEEVSAAANTCLLPPLEPTTILCDSSCSCGLAGLVWQLRLPLKPPETTVELRCYIDHSVLEAYGTDGRAAITSRTYPLNQALGAGLWAEGGAATLLTLEAYEMDSIWVG